MYWMNIRYKKIQKPETTEGFSSTPSESWNGKNNVCPWDLLDLSKRHWSYLIRKLNLDESRNGEMEPICVLNIDFTMCLNSQ